MTFLNMAICTMLFEKLQTILREEEPRRQDITNFSFKLFKKLRSLRSSKCFQTTVELTFPTQKASACNPWTARSLFNWKYFLGGKFGLETENYQFKFKFCTQTNSNTVNSMVMFTFFVLDWKYLFGQISSKKSKLSV